MESDRSKGFVNLIQYNSWFKKLPNLHSAIHNGSMQANKSNRIIYSFRVNFFLQENIENKINTHRIHQMNDIHHCRILNISIGFSMKFLKSYISTCQSLHQIKTHKISMINNDSKSFSKRFCILGNFLKTFFFQRKKRKKYVSIKLIR